jgi:hypothetical protein
MQKSCHPDGAQRPKDRPERDAILRSAQDDASAW